MTELNSNIVDFAPYTPGGLKLRSGLRLAVAGFARLFARRPLTGEELERAIAMAALREDARRKVDRLLLR